MPEFIIQNTTYKYMYWDGTEPTEALTENRIAIDTETEMIIDGDPIKPVIMQVYFPKKRLVHIVSYKHFQIYMNCIFNLNPDVDVVMHNAAFDLGVIDNKYLWRSLKEEHVIDTGIRFQLHNMEN